MSVFSRARRFASLLPLFVLLAAPASAQVAKAPAAPAAPAQVDHSAWLYRGSDVPPDPKWQFGTLSNGVRYAVRRNGVPPGQVAIRVRIDAGSLMETDAQRGYAHLIEHLSFRGSKNVPDSESKRIWQRLGVTFGSDSNATTTFTSTVYKLDLPDADEAGIDESLNILADMMEHPAITQAALDSERPVVLAEGREQPGPQVRMNDAMLGLIFAGQPLADRKPIGLVNRLEAATPASVQAFHDKWYRPERAVVIAAGDVDPAMLERLIVKHFSGWQGVGPKPADPDFGTPEPGHPVAATIVEPALPIMVTMGVVRPWTVTADTQIFNQKRMVDLVATRIMNRRLESRARAGASYIGASVDLDDVSRSANVTSVQILVLGDDWVKALKDVRGVIADTAAEAPTQADIDRELAEIDAGMRNSIQTEPVEAGAKEADDLAQALDIHETVTNAAGSYSIFKAARDKGMFNPAAVQASAKRIFEGVATRALVNLHAPDSAAVTKLTAALDGAPVTSAERRRALGKVSFDQFPKFGTPGKVISRSVVLDSPHTEKVMFANGVSLLIHASPAETSKVYVHVRFGGGLNALPANRESAAWAAQLALISSGEAGLGQEELDALTGNRQIGFTFGTDEDAFTFFSQTTKEDLGDQLKLFAAKLSAPGWDPNPVIRARAVMLSGYAALSSSPDGVLTAQLDRLLHSGDPRWGIPPRAVIEATTPASFRKLWEPLLASGPIEVQVFGDMDAETAIQQVAATFGALKPRPASNTPPPAVHFPAHVDTPVVLTHSGQADQAAAVIAWPTGGGSAGITESRKLDILAAVFRDRLIDRLRSQAGVSYSPNVASNWPLGMPGGGRMMALGLVPPDKTGFFFKLAREIAADLAANPISNDELRRSLVPLSQLIIRRSSGNMFWMQQMEGGAFDPQRITAINTLAPDIARTTPAELQALAAKYLVPAKDWTLIVVPQKQK